MNQKIFYVFFGLFLLVGLLVAAWGIRYLYLSSESTKWPSSEAEITASKVSSHRSSRRQGRHRVASRTYSAKINYLYWVRGVEYTGNRISFGDYSSSNKNHALSLVARYPVGKKVLAYYHPKDCAVSVLEPGFQGGILIPLGIGVIFAFVGAGGIFYARKNFR